MFALIEFLLVTVAWWIGKVFANYFEGRKPKKTYAALFCLPMGITLFAVFATVRYYVGGWMLNDPTLQLRVDWFGPLDPPAIFMYIFLGYGGAVSYYTKPKP